MRPDLFDRAVQLDPYPTYDWLRENAPVYEEPRFGNRVLTRYDDVLSALRDHATYSSARGISPSGPDRGSTGALTSLDPPRHDRMRGIVNRAFTPGRVGRMEGRIEALVRELLDSIEDDAFDLVARLSGPLPVIVIAEMMGVDPERGEEFKRWSDALVGALEREIGPEERVAVSEMTAYFRTIAVARRTDPRDDLVSALVHAELDGESLAEREILGFCLQLLVAGNETTTNLISNLLEVLLDRPDLWDALRADRTRLDAAIEEALRWDSPVQLLARTLTRDVELHGVEVPTGARVLVSYGAANRDPAAFEDPHAFRLDRGVTRHVAFGFGVHYCLGAPLARLETRLALDGLLDRYPKLERGGTGERVASSVIRGFARLPVRAAA